jgi:anti-sigma factor RsiW
MTHPDPDVLLDLALETLPESNADEVRAHVGACAECSARYERLEEEQRALAAAIGREPALPGALRSRIVSALPRPLRRAPRFLVALAAAVALAAGLALLKPDERKQQMLETVRVSELMALGLEVK